jgi:hypothetical protein
MKEAVVAYFLVLHKDTDASTEYNLEIPRYDQQRSQESNPRPQE